MDLSQAVDSLILAVIASVVGYLVKYGVLVAKELVIKFKVETFVKAAENIYNGSGLGNAKYQFVADRLVELAKKIHIKLDTDKVQEYVEAAVKDLHIALNKELDKPVEEVKSTEEATK
jgi:hypothetical protein